MRFRKGKGLTPSERLLARLCERSFLSVWSYPNLFRKAAKELTDLLVVFGDDVILFSDKSRAYPDTGDAALDWRRWFGHSVAESARQITQAEKWIIRQPHRVYLDAREIERLPIPLPPSDWLRFHRICIALGAADRCKNATGRPTLEISPQTIDDGKAFSVGRITGALGWVHVFDETTLPLILEELNTAPDFIEYLKRKEEFYDAGKFERAASESDLLGYYLWHGRAFPMQHLKRCEVADGTWREVAADPQFQASRKENQGSIFWDRLVEYLNRHYLAENLETGNEHPFADYERFVRTMAQETRFSRRILANWMTKRIDRNDDGYLGSLVKSPYQPDVVYVLVVGPGDGGREHISYRKERFKELRARCIVAKALQPDCTTVLGIAVDKKGTDGTSEDIMYLDVSEWTTGQSEYARKARKAAKLFLGRTAETSEVHRIEYPVA
jgi:hypothetical protein